MKDNLIFLVKEYLEPEETVMVHGTSLEAVIEFLKKGKLIGETFSKTRNKRYLYFVPNKGHFIGHPLYQRLKDLSWGEDILHEAAVYARIFAAYHFYAATLCNTSSDLPMILLDNPECGIQALITEFRRKGQSENEALRFVHELRSRRGVIFSVDRKIFELEIKEGTDNSGEEVRVYVPRGLDLRYVNGILPLGDIERSYLVSFVQSLPSHHAK